MKQIIEQVSVGEMKSGTGKNGKPYTMYPIGLKIGGVWHNGSAFGDAVNQFKEMKAGAELECELYEEEYNGKMYKKFRIPNDRSKQNEKIDRIEKTVEAIYKELREISKRI